MVGSETILNNDNSKLLQHGYMQCKSLRWWRRILVRRVSGVTYVDVSLSRVNINQSDRQGCLVSVSPAIKPAARHHPGILS